MYYDETKYGTCPECAGTGMDNYSLDHKCYHCWGTGRVEVKDEDNNKDKK